MSENSQQSETCIVIGDKSQGSVATYLRCDGILILNYFKLQLSVRLRIVNRSTFAKFWIRRLIVS